jgi:hypothetical protein
MQYTESIVDCLKGIAQEHPGGIDWQSACEQVKDPRRKQGKRYSISSILLLALAAILSNHLSELAIAEWGAGQSDEIKQALGFENGVTPHQSTIQRLFRRVNAEEVESAFRAIFLQLVNSQTEKRGESAVSIDGKAQRGRLKFEEKHGYAVHAVSLVDHQTGIVLSQGHVKKTDLEPEGEAPAVETQSTLSEEQEQKALSQQRKRKVSLPSLLASSNTSIGKAKCSQEMPCIARDACALRLDKQEEIICFW